MLILGRREGESIVIGNNIHVTVTQVIGKTVRIGIAAPPDIPVHRREIYHRIKRDEEQQKW
ncbi:MAG: carbon storage regulator CsrA [Gammaproteobacteria bacterium]|nr:carbon storage regulator CsrA [Gammaproteobacteria bacterium]